MKLVISPHIDDEVLGCGGSIDKETLVYFCAADESLFNKDGTEKTILINELSKVAQIYGGFNFRYNIISKVNFLYQDFNYVKDEIEYWINMVRPDKIFIPYPGFNQDHKTVYDACLVALRPHDKNFFVKKILVYEAIHDFIWVGEDFKPNYFVPIDIDKKLLAYNAYLSQVRSFRSSEMIKDLAALRGAAIKVPYAEAFQILRWVD